MAYNPVVCVIFQAKNAGKPEAEDLLPLLAGHVEVLGQHIADFEATPVNADYFITFNSQVAEVVKRIRPQSRVIVSSFALNIQELPKLLSLPAGTNCLVVRSTQQMAEDTISLLSEFGFGWLNFVPWWPSKNTLPDKIEVAITTASQPICPANVSNIIELGPRVVDVVTLARLCLDLELPHSIIFTMLIDYIKEVKALGKAYLNVYKESEHARAYLKAVLDSMKDAIAVIDINGDLKLSNVFFKRLIKEADLTLDQFLENCTESPGILQIKGKYFATEKISVRSQTEANLLGTLLVIRPTEKISEAEQALRRAIHTRGHVALYRFSDIIGISSQIKKVITTAKKTASSNHTVLITGETGTGKELFAHAIHSASLRAAEPFVCTNFAAMPATLIESELFGYDGGAFTGAKKGGHPGFFEQAHRGSIFLDEIGDAPLTFQPHLLRVLEDKRVMRIGGKSPIPIDVRVIVATNQDLNTYVEQGRFREDLFYRLNVIPLWIPPLRSRREDIPILAKHFLSLMDESGNRRFTPELLEYLQNYSWPGNIRQLENVIKYVVHSTETEVIDVTDLPPTLPNIKSVLANGITNSEEMMQRWDGNRTLVSLILDTLATVCRSGKHAGKKDLITKARERGLGVSDYKIRKVLQQLDNEGLLHIGSTSQGTAITEKGLAWLQSHFEVN